MVAKQTLVVIVGETASGKTAVAIELAERLDGEIICADSRTIYKGMDLGTAKPSSDERKRVVHHMLDVAEVDERFTVVDFKRMADALINDISARGKLPILVGGSGLYVDAVIYDYRFADMEEGARRDPINPRHLIKDDSRPKQQILRYDTVLIGLSLDREALKQKITDRVNTMVESGLVREVEELGKRYGWEAPALQAPGYKAFREYIQDALTIDEAKQKFIKSDIDLAKRQRTWFKRNKSIHWVDDPRKAVEIATTLLSKIQ